MQLCALLCHISALIFRPHRKRGLSACLSVGLCVCVCCRMIDMPLVGLSHRGPKNHVLNDVCVSRSGKSIREVISRRCGLLSNYFRHLYCILPRDAMLVRYMLWPCVRLSVHLFVCHKLAFYQTARSRITQRIPRYSTGIL